MFIGRIRDWHSVQPVNVFPVEQNSDVGVYAHTLVVSWDYFLQCWSDIVLKMKSHSGEVEG